MTLGETSYLWWVFSRIMVDVGTSPGSSKTFDLHHVAFASEPLCWGQDTSN